LKRSREIAVAPFYRILRQEGASRVSKEAATKLRDIVEELAREIARESWALAQHARRKTVVGEDVVFAARRVLKQVRISELEV